MLLEKLSGKTMRWRLGVVPEAGFSTLKGPVLERIAAVWVSTS
jgi:hypothetical protein